MEAEKQILSLHDLLEMGEDARVEIVEWELTPMVAAGGVHQIIAMNIIRVLDGYVSSRDLGQILPDGMTYLMNSQSSGLRNSFVPDVSFISNENVPQEWDAEKPHPGTPNLAVEIISPGDNADDVQRKLRTYLDEGTEQIWLVYPRSQEIHQYINGTPEQVKLYRGSTSIDADALFPGLEGLTLEAIFKLPKWALKD